MGNNVLKIPVLAISCQTEDQKSNDYSSFNETTFVEDLLPEIDDLGKQTNGAYLILGKEENVLFPLYVKWYLVKIDEKIVDGEDGYSIGLCLVDEFDCGSFDIEYGYDMELDSEIPKYIIFNNIS